jgi:septum formation protein
MSALVLASTSPYRRELLQRLGLRFEVSSPPYEEGPVPGLAPCQLAQHHALGKARSVAVSRPGDVVIGSDQVAELDGTILGKPGTMATARAQLQQMAGRWVDFWTGLAVVRDRQERACTERYRVRLRELRPAEIDAYLALEAPLQSAGSFKIEGAGIALMQALEGRDYTALVGLPLIALTDLLGEFGITVLQAGTRNGAAVE